jgi:hypothetical protein
VLGNNMEKAAECKVLLKFDERRGLGGQGLRLQLKQDGT